MAFQWAFNISGGMPLIQTFTVKNAEVITEGMMVSMDTGEVVKAAHGDAAIIGIAVHDADNTSDGLTVRVIVNRDAVYSVVDANARAVDADLDLDSAATGVTTDSSHTFKVFRDSGSIEPTLVYINAGNHWLDA